MATATKSSDFAISRVLDAPRDLVWKCLTNPERMKQWWGPKGFTVIASKMDLRVGGTYHYCLKAPDGTPMWGKFVFREIVRPNAWTSSARFPMRKAAPPVIPVTRPGRWRCIRHSPSKNSLAARPKFTIRWAAHNATPEEQKVFDSSHPRMKQGWSGTLEQLEGYLTKTK